ncbi:hypothetical protein VPH35_001683 [Triticum aestivum]
MSTPASTPKRSTGRWHRRGLARRLAGEPEQLRPVPSSPFLGAGAMPSAAAAALRVPGFVVVEVHTWSSCERDFPPLPSPPAALPRRPIPWARPGLGVSTAMLRLSCRRSTCGAAERPDNRSFRFAAADQLSSFSRPQRENLQVAVCASKAVVQPQQGPELTPPVGSCDEPGRRTPSST